MDAREWDIAVVPDGDGCWLVRVGDGIDPQLSRHVHALAGSLARQRPAWLIETVPGYCTLGLVTSSPIPQDTVETTVREALAGCTDDERVGRTVTVPVCYGGEHGPDLDDVAAHAGMSAEEVVRRHSSRDYQCAMVGFLPGFPYLTGMDPSLATPRRPTPRISVPGGSVGVAGPQTGIYPVASPGGWNIIGRTPLTLFDQSVPSPAFIQPGDTVRFVPVAPAEYGRMSKEPDHVIQPLGDDISLGMLVLEAGLATTVQDDGRWGLQALGVPVSGAMDPHVMELGNILVGNGPHCAGLEITLTGPTLAVERDTVIALVGTDMAFTINGAAAPMWTAVRVQPGDTVSVGDCAGAGCRAWLCVAGGIDTPVVLGSRSTLLRATLGGMRGRALRQGDHLPVGNAPAAARLDGLSCPPDLVSLQDEPVPVLPGPQESVLADDARRAFFTTPWIVTDVSDRMGCRLDGTQLRLAHSADIISEMTPLGAVQVADAGLPMVLLADRQTTGGYAKPFIVATAALGRMAQLVPGDRVHFTPCTHSEARELLRHQAECRARLLAMQESWLGRESGGSLRVSVNGTLHIIRWQKVSEEGHETDRRSQQ